MLGSHRFLLRAVVDARTRRLAFAPGLPACAALLATIATVAACGAQNESAALRRDLAKLEARVASLDVSVDELRKAGPCCAQPRGDEAPTADPAHPVSRLRYESRRLDDRYCAPGSCSTGSIQSSAPSGHWLAAVSAPLDYIRLFDDAPHATPGYCSETQLTFPANAPFVFDNARLCKGPSSNLVTHLAFDVAPGRRIRVKVGVDFGLGGVLLRDGVPVDYRLANQNLPSGPQVPRGGPWVPGGMWWEGKWDHPFGVLADELTSDARRPHHYDIYGAEGCCGGEGAIQVELEP